MLYAGKAETRPPKKTRMKNGLTMMSLIVFMVVMPSSASKVARAGMIVFEKMNMTPAAIELRITEINMIPSATELTSHLLLKLSRAFRDVLDRSKVLASTLP